MMRLVGVDGRVEPARRASILEEVRIGISSRRSEVIPEVPGLGEAVAPAFADGGDISRIPARLPRPATGRWVGNWQGTLQVGLCLKGMLCLLSVLKSFLSLPRK
jgi:hypothetical protein